MSLKRSSRRSPLRIVFPHDVEVVERILSESPSDSLCDIAKKLMVRTPELSAMWKTFEKRNTCNLHCDWVWSFLRDAERARSMPPIHYKTARQRRELSTKIMELARELSHALESNELDAHFTYCDGKIFNGFYIYEELGYHNQVRIDANGREKLIGRDAIAVLTERARKKISDEPGRGKAGKNIRAIRFIRFISERNLVFFRSPLYAATANAANALFKTSYEASDVRKLLSR